MHRITLEERDGVVVYMCSLTFYRQEVIAFVSEEAFHLFHGRRLSGRADQKANPDNLEQHHLLKSNTLTTINPQHLVQQASLQKRKKNNPL